MPKRNKKPKIPRDDNNSKIGGKPEEKKGIEKLGNTFEEIKNGNLRLDLPGFMPKASQIECNGQKFGKKRSNQFLHDWSDNCYHCVKRAEVSTLKEMPLPVPVKEAVRKLGSSRNVGKRAYKSARSLLNGEGKEKEETAKDNEEENWESMAVSQNIHVYNKEICELMNELYLSRGKTKSKMQRILSDAKKIVDKDTANSVFISIYQNIKAYMKKKKQVLHNKLRELEIAQPKWRTRNDVQSRCTQFRKRFNSFGPSCPKKENSPYVERETPAVTHTIALPRGSNYIIQQITDSPESYIQFLIFLCDIYRELVASTSTGIEAICQAVLSQCHPNNEISGYDIHKSLFHEFVLQDDLIRDCIANARRFLRKDENRKRYPDLRVILKAVRKINEEIGKCRVKITVGSSYEEPNQKKKEESPKSSEDDSASSEGSYLSDSDSFSESDESQIESDIEELIERAKKREKPIWNRPFEEIMSFIEEPREKKLANMGGGIEKDKLGKRRRKRKKEKKMPDAQTILKNLLPLNGIDILQEDSLGERRTSSCSPHNQIAAELSSFIKADADFEKSTKLTPNIPPEGILKFKAFIKARLLLNANPPLQE